MIDSNDGTEAESDIFAFEFPCKFTFRFMLNDCMFMFYKLYRSKFTFFFLVLYFNVSSEFSVAHIVMARACTAMRNTIIRELAKQGCNSKEIQLIMEEKLSKTLRYFLRIVLLN